MSNPIHIEVWSDFVCPFCYIGKRNLESALAQFGDRSAVRITWKSFELDPAETRDPSKGLLQRLADKYGRDLAWAASVTDDVTRVALNAGLHFRLDRAVPANTFNAHRLHHLARRHGREDAVGEHLLQAYFVNGEDLNDAGLLRRIGVENGVPAAEIDELLGGDALSLEVRGDEKEAVEGGINAVPFFLFNRKFAVRGAQPVETFLSALHHARDVRAIS